MLNTASTPPNLSPTSAACPNTAFLSDTSTAAAKTEPDTAPHRSTVSFTADPSRSERANRTPALASCTASSRPIPAPAPVTATTRPPK